jgi:hypothetical protein
VPTNNKNIKCIPLSSWPALLDKNLKYEMVRSDLHPRPLERSRAGRYNGNRRRIWKWIGHVIRKGKGVTEMDALDWNPQGSKVEALESSME